MTKQILVLTYILASIWLLGGSLLIVLYLVHYSINIIYLIYASLLFFAVILCQVTLIAPAVALAAIAKWKLSQRANSQRESWPRKSFSRSISRTGSTYT
jgi:membrane protein implicated in regulation of membrane protease activity